MTKAIFLSVSSAILLILSYPLPNLEFLAWVAFVPLFFAIENKKPLARFLLGYITGIIFFAGTIYWLVHVTLAGVVVLVLYLALYFGVFGLLLGSSSIIHRPLRGGFASLRTPSSFVSIPALWVLLEYTRSNLFTGFGWNLLPYSQSYNLPIIQIAALVGAYGVSFVVMMVNVAVYKLVTRNQSTETRK